MGIHIPADEWDKIRKLEEILEKLSSIIYLDRRKIETILGIVKKMSDKYIEVTFYSRSAFPRNYSKLIESMIKIGKYFLLQRENVIVVPSLGAYKVGSSFRPSIPLNIEISIYKKSNNQFIKVESYLIGTAYMIGEIPKRWVD